MNRITDKHLINRTTHPELYTAMDAAAAQYWAYPDNEWQHEFIDQWLAQQPADRKPTFIIN
jgi:hypothetical protein